MVIARAALEAKAQLSEIALFCNTDASAILATITVALRGKADFNEVSTAMSARVPDLKGIEWLAEGHRGQPARSIRRWGERSIAYRAAGFDYRVDHGAFFQVNRLLVDAFVERVTADRSGTLAWDLFAGVGLFARKLPRQLMTASSLWSPHPRPPQSLDANLKHTCSIRHSRRNACTFCIATKSARAGPVVVDPPRAGLGAEITSLQSRRSRHRDGLCFLRSRNAGARPSRADRWWVCCRNSHTR